MGFCNPMGVLLIMIAYKVFTPGSTGSFRKDNGMRLAGVVTITLALTHPMLPIWGRAWERGVTWRPTWTGCPPCSGTSYTLHCAKGFWCRLQACPGMKPPMPPTHMYLQREWWQRRCRSEGVTVLHGKLRTLGEAWGVGVSYEKSNETSRPEEQE
jgi:hypothetical protein